MKSHARPSWRTGVMFLVAALPLANAGAAAIQANEAHIPRRWACTQRGDRNSNERIATTPATAGADTWFLFASSLKWMAALMITQRE
jgi:hypothetical protein